MRKRNGNYHSFKGWPECIEKERKDRVHPIPEVICGDKSNKTGFEVSVESQTELTILSVFMVGGALGSYRTEEHEIKISVANGLSF